MSFQLDLSKFAAKTKRKANALCVKVVMDVSTSLVLKSPVGNPSLWKHPDRAPKGYVGGRFRGNWQYGEGAPPAGTLPGVDPAGAATIGRLHAAVGMDAAGKVHYLVNNLPYGPAIEKGHSRRQAPAGVVGITVVEFQAVVDAAAGAQK